MYFCAVICAIFVAASEAASPEAVITDPLRLEAQKALNSLKNNQEDLKFGQVSERHGLVLVPLCANRFKRSPLDGATSEKVSVASDEKEDGEAKPKYKRLSHSVHVQTDIRYR
jgi:hypothetical protein